MLKAVIAAGADAVYIGGSRFGARAYADNPNEDELLEGLDYAHLRQVRVYLTVNTLLKKTELNELTAFIRPYVDRGLDGVLIQDMGVARVLKAAFPDLPLHTSTQMTVTGPAGAALMKKHGFTRVVPARELTLEELKAIRNETGLEVEAFVHGALCYCYSGQCLMSSLIGGRSGNRGRCAQPCRLPYSANGKAGSLLSLRDLCVIDELPALIEAGVTSLKIEGRMKQPAYAAGVTAVYRRYLDLAFKDPAHYHVEEADRKLLDDLFNREGHTGGYLHQHNGPAMMAMADAGGHTSLAQADADQIRRKYLDREKKVPVSGHAVLRPGKCPSLTWQTVLRDPEKAKSESYSPVRVTVTGSEEVLQAQNRPVTAERIRQQLMKTGGTDFEAVDLTVDCDNGLFIRMGVLNELRRTGLEALRQEILASFTAPRTASDRPAGAKEAGADEAGNSEPRGNKPMITASCETEEQFRAICACPETAAVYYPAERILEEKDPFAAAERLVCLTRDIAGPDSSLQLYLALPYIERRKTGSPIVKELPDYFEEQMLKAGFAGFLVRSPETLARLSEKGLAPLSRLDAGLYVWTDEAAAFYRELGVQALTAPFELNKKELLRNAGLYDEIVVYGRLPLMISAQCVQKNTEKCLGRTRGLYLKDRTNRQFYVKNVCAFCYNVIYNSLPLDLTGEEDAFRRMMIPARRYLFTDEPAEDIGRILSEGPDREAGAYTKGHYGRGVE